MDEMASWHSWHSVHGFLGVGRLIVIALLCGCGAQQFVQICLSLLSY